MDTPQLQEAAFHYREAEFPVPELEGWGYFPDGEDLVWKARQISITEICRAADRHEEDQKLVELATALAFGNINKEEDLRKVLGVADEDVPFEARRRIAIVTYGTVYPAIGPENRQKIVELSVTHPQTFNKIYFLIDKLTDMGAVLGKPKPSGESEK